MNVLPRQKQIEVIAALCEGVGIRTASRLTGVNRGTVGSFALRVGRGCQELHDRLMVGIRTERPRHGHSSEKRTSCAMNSTPREISTFLSRWPDAKGNH